MSARFPIRVSFKLGPRGSGPLSLVFVQTAGLWLALWWPLWTATGMGVALLRLALFHTPIKGVPATTLSSWLLTFIPVCILTGVLGLDNRRWTDARDVLADSDVWQKRIAATRWVVTGVSGLTVGLALVEGALLSAADRADAFVFPAFCALAPALFCAMLPFGVPAMAPLGDEVARDIRARAFLAGFWTLAIGAVGLVFLLDYRPALAVPALVILLWLASTTVAVAAWRLERRAEREG